MFPFPVPYEELGVCCRIVVEFVLEAPMVVTVGRWRVSRACPQGMLADQRDRAGDHELALKVSGIGGAVPDLHERGRLRQVEACELGPGEGVKAPMVLTAGPTLSVPVRSVWPFRKSSGMSVMA
eukprot:scaffold41940_cov46-Phaeocystis_antarctica.AAC.2